MSGRTYAVVMAGGAGTRFWPLSRAARPKQLLPLAGGDEALLARTVARVAPLVPAERTIVVTSAALAPAVRDALPAVPAHNVLAEPVGRGTAPCVAWAAVVVRARDPDAIVAVLPSDHAVADVEALRRTIGVAVEAARGGALVTIGVRPSRPDTGFGYIETGEAIAPGVLRVARFVEKPGRAAAEGFARGGRHLWNSGMFFFRAAAILDALAEHAPEVFAQIDRIARAPAARARETLAEAFDRMPNVSIDVGVMERARDVAVVPAEFGWSDLGSWEAAYALRAGEADGDGNVGPATLVAHDAARALVIAPEGKTVAIVGVDDLVVVDTPDALLVARRDRAQDVRHVVETLRRRGEAKVL